MVPEIGLQQVSSASLTVHCPVIWAIESICE
jgi:hypothetical protein